jgi:twinkle protein
MASAEKGAAVLDRSAANRPRVFSPSERIGSVLDLWDRGLPPGEKTGWPSLDQFYTVVPGQLTIITGWPGSGKSEWLDALLVNLARRGWNFCVFSPENQPVDLHIAKFLEKLSGKPFGPGPTERISKDEVKKYGDELAQRFGFIEPPGDGSLTANEVIEAAEPMLRKFDKGMRGLVIDPWNELEHWRPANLSETEYVSKTLSFVRNWARRNGVHVWIVAHPQKVRREDGKLPIPRPDMISGSQHWWNKADCAITVYRNIEELDKQDVQIIVQKVRFKHVGRPGLVELKWDRVTGRYNEPLRLATSRYRNASEGE